MTQEDKNLVLKDLSARLPYRTIVKMADGGIEPLLNVNVDTFICNGLKGLPIPYLRSVSNITEKEKDLLDIASAFLRSAISTKSLLAIARASSALTWICYELHLDINGLIPKGLALEAPEGMYE